MRSSKLSLRFRLVCVAAAVLLLSLRRSRAEVPTPISVLGHNPGDDFYLADYEDTVRYFHALARGLRPHQDVHGGKNHPRQGH